MRQKRANRRRAKRTCYRVGEPGKAAVSRNFGRQVRASDQHVPRGGHEARGAHEVHGTVLGLAQVVVAAMVHLVAVVTAEVVDVPREASLGRKKQWQWWISSCMVRCVR